jgi:tetratricopeptide (TPR) repeat protein
VDIKRALVEIESGNIQNALTYLQEFKNSSPNDPSVIFLDGVLTQNGEDALKKYSTVYEKYPKSNYADASLYRIFSYYFALGYYKKAESYLDKLKTGYPNSPYIKTADRTIPDEEDSVSAIDEKQNPAFVFTIQAGAFLNSDNAKKLKDQLQNDGYSSEIIIKEIGGSFFNIVYVGKYENENDTKPVLVFLLNKYSIKGRTVPLSTANN